MLAASGKRKYSSNNKKKCVVRGCENNSVDNPNMTFHAFPTQPSSSVVVTDCLGNKRKVDKFTAWQHVLKIRLVNKSMRVCSAHFKTEDYLYPDLNYRSKRPLLTKSAVPSVNIPVLDIAEDKNLKARVQKKKSLEKGQISKQFPEEEYSTSDYSDSSDNKVSNTGDLSVQDVASIEFAQERDLLKMKCCEDDLNAHILAQELQCNESLEKAVHQISSCGDEEPEQDLEFPLHFLLTESCQREEIVSTSAESEYLNNSPPLDETIFSNVCDKIGNTSNSEIMNDSGMWVEESLLSDDTDFNADPPSDPIGTKRFNTSLIEPSNGRAEIDLRSSASHIHKEHETSSASNSQIEEMEVESRTLRNEQVHSATQASYKYSILDIIKTDKQLSTATGIESFKVLDVIVGCMKIATDYRFEKPPIVMDTRKRVLMTYVKIKHNISYKFLSLIFGLMVTEQHCGRIFIQTVLMLNKVMKEIALPWPTKETIKKNLPKCFEDFKHTRIVLDCTEMKIQIPQNLCCQIQCFSNYKGCETIKIMTGVTAGGVLSYASKPYGGRFSDSAIFEQSGLVKLLEPGDGVMVDKGFLIDRVCQMNKLCLIRPPFLRQKKRFSAEEAILTKKIAKARVHVERFNQRIKVFDMLGGVYPVSLVPIIGEVFNVVCGTINLSTPIIADDKFMGN